MKTNSVIIPFSIDKGVFYLWFVLHLYNSYVIADIIIIINVYPQMCIVLFYMKLNPGYENQILDNKETKKSIFIFYNILVLSLEKSYEYAISGQSFLGWK